MIMLNSYVAFDFPAEIETFTSLFKETGLKDFITMGGDGSTAMGKTMLANDWPAYVFLGKQLIIDVSLSSPVEMGSPGVVMPIKRSQG